METANQIHEKDLDENNKSLWLKAITAIERNNYEFAISIIKRVLESNPGFLDGRKTLRAAEIQSSKGKKESKFLFIPFGKGGGGMSFKMGSRSKQDPLEAIKEVEEALEKDPYNIAANQALFEASVRAGMSDTAAFALETIKEGHPGNTRNLHQLAEHYMAMDLPDKSADTYRQILRSDPTDMDAIQGEKNSSARSAMKKGNWESGDMRKMLQNEEESRKLEGASRAGMTQEQLHERLNDLWSLYHQDNNDIATVKKIADTYEKLEDWASALQWYEWALHLNTGDVAMEARVGKLREKAAEAELQKLEAAINENPDSAEAAELRAQLDAKKRERGEKLLAEAKARIERNPTDKQMRFDLALRLYELGDYTEAIPHLQQAKTSPHLRTRAMLLLGQCFQQKKMYDMAVGQFEESLKEITIMDATKKQLLYELGLVFEAMGQKERSLDCMKEIYNSDYGYRDVAARVEASYG